MQNPTLAFVRILISTNSQQRPIGAGFLIAHNLVLSCTHVVLDALNLPKNTQEKPEKTLSLDFPFVENKPIVLAKVLEWYPLLDNPHSEGIEDLALLELTEKIPFTKPLLLDVSTNYYNRPVRLVGFPRGQDEGIHLDGVLKDLTGDGKVQIDIERGRGDVAEGFSGSAVYDTQENAVVGIIVMKASYGSNMRAFMTPAATIIKAFPQLEQFTCTGSSDKNESVISSKRFISRLPPAARLFTDRIDALSELHKCLEKEHIVAVSGLPAVGKTQAALHYIEKNKVFYKTVIWLIGTTVSELEKTIEDFVSGLESFHSFSQNIKATYNIFIKWLQDNDGWLIVLDNLKSLDIARDIISLSINGHIIITSRVSFRESFAEIHIIPFDGDNAALFFIRRAFQEFRQSSLCDIPPELVAQANNIIAKQLSRHPLVLEYSAALISANHWDLNIFMDKLKTRGKKLVLSENTPTIYDYPETLGITFKLCFDEVQANDIVATDILRVCAFLSPESIPIEIFTCTGYELGNNIANAILEDSRFDNALRILLRYSLIERDRKDITNISVQTIVQDIIREQMTQEESCLWANRVINALNKLFPTPDFNSWNECNRLLAHTLRFAEEWISNYALTSKPAGSLLTRLAAYQFERGKLESVESFLLQAIGIFLHIGIDAHQDQAESHLWLAKLYESQGKFDGALINIDESIKLYKDSTSIGNLDTAKTLVVKGIILQQYEKYAEAKRHFKSAILIIEKLYGQQCDEFCHALYFLGKLYYEQGKYSFAKKFYEKSLNLLKDIPNGNEIIKAKILNALGLLYSDIGDIENADATLQMAIKIWQSLDVEHHFEYGIAINNLGRVKIMQGEDDLAEKAFEKAISVWNIELGKDHHLIANSFDLLAVLLLKRGELEKAEKLIEESKKIRDLFFGYKNSELSLSYYVEGLLFLCKEEITSALKAFIKAKELIQKRRGRYHPYMIDILIGVGVCHFRIEDYKASYKNFKETLKVVEKNQGYMNLVKIDIYHFLALNSQALHQNNEAVEMYKNALNIAHKILGPTHPVTLSVKTEYTSYLEEIGQIDEAGKLEIK